MSPYLLERLKKKRLTATGRQASSFAGGICFWGIVVINERTVVHPDWSQVSDEQSRDGRMHETPAIIDSYLPT